MNAHQLNAILDLASGLIRRSSEADSPLKPTDFYCEGWLTALTALIVTVEELTSRR
ncbi:hypothetical protein [Urbifossiella limnaea]|uniref:Uncharacterized protein n=1 Tax=Urbifossiella limnaea TaxID=2528023 RepID=A0A517XNA9_9BACT|nr:hypothetical protein [Urbifossiella limnaea]QDU18989.1 hypothetical protein ETAA1_08900 [Urbifossiella limnaea]